MKEILNLKNFKAPKVSMVTRRKASKNKVKVDQTTILDTSMTTKTILDDNVFIETEFPSKNANNCSLRTVKRSEVNITTNNF